MSNQPRPGDVIAKTYEIESRLGAGPLGSTWLARLMGNNQRVVLKLIDGPATDAETLQNTIQAVSALKVEGLVRILRAGVWQNQSYIIYEHLEAESLRRLMDSYAGQRRYFSMQEAGQITVKLLDTLDSIHAAGFVHLHVKPSSVLINTKFVGPGQGRPVHTPRISGLGQSSLIHPSVLQQNLNENPDSRYMAPDAGAATRQADIYSVGVIFYELLCGQTPMGSYLSPTQIREDLPKKVDDIIEIALAPNAEDRYLNARDMLNDIQRLFQEEEIHTPPPDTRRRRLAIIGGAATLLLILVMAIFLQDPEKAARNKDAELRATAVKASVKPSDETVQAKLVKHPDMVWIPEGQFIHGRMNAEKGVDVSEPTAVLKTLPAYYIDRFESPNQQGEHSTVKATWEEARAACEGMGKRLCSDLEWERACKGPESFVYSYGDTFKPDVCGADIASDSNKDRRSDHRAGSLAECKSGYGVFDMSGGPREWTASTGSRDASAHILRGGKKGISFNNGSRCSYMDEQKGTWSDSVTSYRCCMDDPEGMPK